MSFAWFVARWSFLVRVECEQLPEHLFALYVYGKMILFKCRLLNVIGKSSIEQAFSEEADLATLGSEELFSLVWLTRDCPSSSLTILLTSSSLKKTKKSGCKGAWRSRLFFCESGIVAGLTNVPGTFLFCLQSTLNSSVISTLRSASAGVGGHNCRIFSVMSNFCHELESEPTVILFSVTTELLELLK